MGKNLTNDHRRLLGTYIAVAKADGILDSNEQKLIEYFCNELDLSESAKKEIASMVEKPPTPEQIAKWAITEQDRLGIYAAAIQMADADGHVASEETVFLNQLASVLQLKQKEVEIATRMGREAAE